jgi:hypothetical protein
MRPTSISCVSTFNSRFTSRTWLLIFATACVCILGMPVPVHAEEAYMNVTFDDKTIDAPIGTGGPAVGEPSSVDQYVTAVVRATPFATPCLEISNTSLIGNVEFQLPSNVSEGIMTIITDLWLYPDSGCDYDVAIRNGFNQVLSKITFSASGTASIWDMTGYAAQDIPYATGRAIQVGVVVDLFGRTYSTFIDTVKQVDSRPLHDQITDVRGVRFSAGYGCPEGNRLSVDDVRMLDYDPVPAWTTSWGKLKAIYR